MKKIRNKKINHQIEKRLNLKTIIRQDKANPMLKTSKI